jgi:hypothetical protein
MKRQTPNRNVMVECGFFDGRYRQKMVKDKKKDMSKRGCRGKKFN